MRSSACQQCWRTSESTEADSAGQARHEAVGHGRGQGIPLGRVLAPASRHDSPLLAPTPDKLAEAGPLADETTVYLDAGYDSRKTRDEHASCGMTGEIAHKGHKTPIQAGQHWHVERTNSRQQLQPAPALLRAQGRSHRRLSQPRRCHHDRP